MIPTALYLRSSKDRSDVSIEAQRRALTQVAQERGLLIACEYSDTVESAKDENRPGFQQLVSDLRKPSRGWSTLLLLDTSRLSRRRHISIIFEHEAEKNGVDVIYKSIPDDADPITTMLLRSIMQAIDEWHSLTSKQKGLSGMAENVRKGYRAGGRAPTGYKLELVQTGVFREGDEITKSRLVPHDSSPVIAKYLSSRAKGIPRTRAAKDAKLDSPSTTLIGIEWNALTYAGHTVWNVRNEYGHDGYKHGVKRRPRSEWIIQKNTHAPLITESEAEAILAALNSKARQYGRVASPYLLSGLLKSLEGKAWEGSGDGYYRLRNPVGRGKFVNAKVLESAVVEQVRKDTSSDEFIGRLVAEARKRKLPKNDAKDLRGEVTSVNAQISRMMDLAGQMTIPAPALRRIEELEEKRTGILTRIEKIERDRATDMAMANVNEAQVRRILASLFAEAEGQENALKAILGGMIERVTLDPATLLCQIAYRVEYRAKLASPRGFEPRSRP